MIVHRYYTRPLGEASDSSEYMPINDATPADAFMTCFGHVRVRTLPNLDEFLIPCDGLSPIAWVDVTLQGCGAWVAGMIRTFDQRCEKAAAGIETESRNLLFVTRGDDAMSLSAIGGMLALNSSRKLILWCRTTLGKQRLMGSRAPRSCGRESSQAIHLHGHS